MAGGGGNKYSGLKVFSITPAQSIPLAAITAQERSSLHYRADQSLGEFVPMKRGAESNTEVGDSFPASRALLHGHGRQPWSLPLQVKLPGWAL